MTRRCARSRGQTLPLMLVVVALALVGVMVVSGLAGAADDAARARTAADAAALAGAAEGGDAARRMAEANGAELLEFVRAGSVVEVLVRVDSATARARAEAILVVDSQR
jgi:hypothetical protein